MSTKTLRWAEFSAMTPDEKLGTFQKKFIDSIVEHSDRFRSDGVGELTPELVFLFLKFRTRPWPVFARSRTFEPETAKAQNFGEALLQQMQSNYALVFGYRKESRFEPGIGALWDYYISRYDGLDRFLIMSDFRGKSMFDALSSLHSDGFKDASQDLIETRIVRLFPR